MTDNNSGSQETTNVNNDLLPGSDIDPYQKQLLEMEMKHKKDMELFRNEMYHLFKNNLQVIVSLLNIQNSYVQDEASHQLFSNSAERVKTIAMVYNKPYQTENPERIYFDRYFKDLVNDIIKESDLKDKIINHKIFTVDTVLPVKTAISLGLIIYELVSNSLRHAFKNVKTGNIEIKLEKLPGEYVLSFEDDGLGLPEDFNIDSIESLGLLLVRSLSDQVNGQLEVTSINGTKFVLKLPGNI